MFLVLSGCRVQLIAGYDEQTYAATTELHEAVELLFVDLEEAAYTPDPLDDLYTRHSSAYRSLIAAVRALETRAGTVDKNELPAEQVRLLRDSLESLQRTHRERSAQPEPQGFSVAALRTLREPVVQQFRSILALQEGLRRD